MTWLLVLLGVAVTAGGCLPALGGWLLASYLFFPRYRCQFCGTRLRSEQYR